MEINCPFKVGDYVYSVEGVHQDGSIVFNYDAVWLITDISYRDDWYQKFKIDIKVTWLNPKVTHSRCFSITSEMSTSLPYLKPCRWYTSKLWKAIFA